MGTAKARVVLRCHEANVLTDYIAGQDNVSAQKAFLEENGCNADRVLRLRCHNFELTKDIAIGAGGVGFDLDRYMLLAEMP